MKILFLTRRAWPEIGGVEKHVLEISKRLVEMGHEVMVVSEDEDGVGFIRPPLADQPMSHRLARAWPLTRIKIFRIPVGRNEKLKKFWIWGWLWNHRDLIKNADLVHAHDVGFWWFPFKLLYSKKPFFITFHGYEQYPVPLKNKIIRKISEKIARGNICVGDFMKKWYGTKVDYVTYGGIDPGSSFGRNDPGSSRSTMKLLFIGRLEEQTGITMYLKALRLLKEKGINFQLTICGDGPLRKEAEKDGKVLGFVENVQPYLQKADFVFASSYLSILEALAARKLVFSVFDNLLKEDYLKLGPLGKLIVICKNENELVEKIKYYSKNQKETDKLTEKAYNWVQKQTWERVTGVYLRLWRFHENLHKATPC